MLELNEGFPDMLGVALFARAAFVVGVRDESIRKVWGSCVDILDSALMRR